MAETKVSFRYNAMDVTSALRVRFLRSTQFRLILILWVLSIIFLLLHVLLPGTFTMLRDVSWTTVWQTMLVYGGTLVALLIVAPWLGFQLNRFWKLPLELTLSDKHLRLAVTGGKSSGLRLEWNEIHRVEETNRVYVLYYRGEKHIIVPKSAFSEQQDRRLRDLLKRHASLSVADQKPPAEPTEPKARSERKK